MAEIKNYLLGYGERLAEKLAPPKTNPVKKDPYSFDEAKVRLAPRLMTVMEEVVTGRNSSSRSERFFSD